MIHGKHTKDADGNWHFEPHYPPPDSAHRDRTTPLAPAITKPQHESETRENTNEKQGERDTEAQVVDT